jgi:hypothetical protein
MPVTPGTLVRVAVTGGRIAVSDSENYPFRSTFGGVVSESPTDPAPKAFPATHDGLFKYAFAGQRARLRVNNTTLFDSTYATGRGELHLHMNDYVEITVWAGYANVWDALTSLLEVAAGGAPQ